MPNYRNPTEKEAAKLDAARKKTQEGIANEKDAFSVLMPTMAKSARDETKAGLKMRESVPASAREGEAYEQAGYKKGGSISKVDMQKAGFYDKDKTKSERQAIVSKVTTKPQRVAIVEKAFLTKNMKSGGSVSTASKRADGCAIRGKTRA